MYNLSWRLLWLSIALLMCSRSIAEDMLEAGNDEEQYEYPKIGQVPFVAFVSSKAGVCTGTIVSEEWLLTAAHCLYFKDKVIGGTDAKVIAGVVDYELPQAFSKQETASQEIHAHPRFWNNRLGKFDVALVKVRDKFIFNDWVSPINISGEQWPQVAPEPGALLVETVNNSLNCMWAGFGGYATTALASTKLKQRNVTAAHGELACPCALRFQTKRLVCVKDTVHPLTCQGDDGGPLVCGNVVRAIIHMVSNRASCETPHYPHPKCIGGADRGLTAFTFLCPLNDWFRSIVDVIPPTPVSCRASALYHHYHFLIAFFFLFRLFR